MWGVQYTVIKTGLTAFPPLFFVAVRFAVIAAILLPFVARPTRRELADILVISVFIGGLNFGLVFIGLMHAPASVAGIANQLWTPLTLLLAWPLLGERPSLQASARDIARKRCGLLLDIGIGRRRGRVLHAAG